MKIQVKSKLGDYLKERGINQAWLAGKIGADPAQVSKWCKNGKEGYAASTPSVGYLLRINQTLKCETKDIYEELDK